MSVLPVSAHGPTLLKKIATAGLIKQIGGRDVLLETHGMDCYERTLATLYVMSDGELINVNERMVMLGHAWETSHLYRHLSPARQRSLRRLQRWAMLNHVGLWKMRGGVGRRGRCFYSPEIGLCG